MFEIEITRAISAAHQLRGYAGNCRNLHGHNYHITVTVRAGSLDAVGIAVDFRKLKTEMDAVLDSYDHCNLSGLPEFAEINPTSEVLAMHIFRRMAERFDSASVKVAKVKVGESDNSFCTYYE
ncbi:MAG: 6-carboxytetrahydropterin synthase [Victivallaceae bacterium]|nr:6-carboxytetrahydropterin synthase [Victivallaceae bacterium]